ncbi:MAG: hypothetical protein MUD01_22230 [Chloroflexaceae bacterium]|nr:hypothetical protein [Chloroflexaceae bacterium]
MEQQESDAQALTEGDAALPPDEAVAAPELVSPPPRHRDPDRLEGVEARIDLHHSHAFMKVSAILTSFNEGFIHAEFDRLEGIDILTDEYENARFHVTYCLHEQGRDEVRVRWMPQVPQQDRDDNELLALARQIAHLLGGGTNLRLLDSRQGGKNRDIDPR